jgi:hypothetical protein
MFKSPLLVFVRRAHLETDTGFVANAALPILGFLEDRKDYRSEEHSSSSVGSFVGFALPLAISPGWNYLR